LPGEAGKATIFAFENGVFSLAFFACFGPLPSRFSVLGSYEEEEGGGVAAVDDDEDEDGVDDADNNGGSNGNKKRAAADDGDNDRPAQRQRKGAAVLQQDVDDDVVYLYTVVRHRNPNHTHHQTESARQVLQRVRGRPTTDADVQAFRHPTRCG